MPHVRVRAPRSSLALAEWTLLLIEDDFLLHHPGHTEPITPIPAIAPIGEKPQSLDLRRMLGSD